MESKGIHCKVSFNDEYRRFIFNGRTQNALHQQISECFSLSVDQKKGMLMKYKDEDNDYITISTDDELVYAIDYSKDNLLRLFVVIPGQAPTVLSKSQNQHTPSPSPQTNQNELKEEASVGGKWKGDRDGRDGRGGRRGGRCGRGGRMGGLTRFIERNEGEDDNHYQYRLEKKKEKIEQTIVVLESLPANEGNIHIRQRKIGFLKEKTALLQERLNTIPKSSNQQVEEKGKRKKLSDEDKKKIAALKESLWNIKEEIHQLKEAILLNKQALQYDQFDVKDKNAKKEVKEDLMKKKGQLLELRKKAASLKDQIHQIVVASE